MNGAKDAEAKARKFLEVMQDKAKQCQQLLDKLSSSYRDVCMNFSMDEISADDAVDNIGTTTDELHALCTHMMHQDGEVVPDALVAHDFTGLTEAMLEGSGRELDPEDPEDAAILAMKEGFARDEAVFLRKYGQKPSTEWEARGADELASLRDGGRPPELGQPILQQFDAGQTKALRARLNSYTDPTPACNAEATKKGPVNTKGRKGGGKAVQNAQMAASLNSGRSGREEGQFRAAQAKKLELNKIGQRSLRRFLSFDE